MSIEDIFYEQWATVKSSFRPQPKINLPQLIEAPYPEEFDDKSLGSTTHGRKKDTEGEEAQAMTACLVYEGRRIIANSRYIDHHVSLGGNLPLLCHGILMHEAGHDQWFPGDAIASIVLSDHADTMFKERSQVIFPQYIDIIDNVKAILTGRGEGILEIYRCMEIDSKERMRRMGQQIHDDPSLAEKLEKRKDMLRVSTLSRMYYGYQAGKDLGIGIDEKLFVKFIGEKKIMQRDLSNYLIHLTKAEGISREDGMDRLLVDCMEKDTTNMFLEYLGEKFGNPGFRGLQNFLATPGAEVDLLARQLESVRGKSGLSGSALYWDFLWRYKGNQFSFYDAYGSYLSTTPGMLGISFIRANGDIYKNGGILDKESLDEQEIILSRYGRLVEDLIHVELMPPGDGDIPKYSQQQFRQALRKGMKWYGRNRYNRLKKKAKQMGYQEKDKKSDNEKGIGTEGGEPHFNDEHVSYYAELARQYPIHIQPKRLEANVKDQCPHHQEQFVLSDPLYKINRYSSGGLILPGVTSKFVDGARKRLVEMIRVPNNVILIDSSGSMDDPTQTKSLAVLAGCSIALNYHLNDAYQAVLNFSGDTVGCDFTRDLETIYSYLLMYQNGGTSVDLKKLEEILRPEDRRLFRGTPTPEQVKQMFGKEYLTKDIEIDAQEGLGEQERSLSKLDIWVISDGGISNLAETLDYLYSMAVKARTHILHIGEWGSFNQEEFPPNVSLYQIDKENDIMDITGGILSQTFSKGEE